MDSAHSLSSSPTSASTVRHDLVQLQLSTSPTLPHLPTRTKSSPDLAINRQRRLIQNRNAKFPAKKLSLSHLSSKFSQLIHANEELQEVNGQGEHQENNPRRPRSLSPRKTHAFIAPFGLLDDIANTNSLRRTRHSADVAIYQDTPERPLLDRSPFSSPALYQEFSSDAFSPAAFDHNRNGTGNMRLREISGNEHRGLPLVESPLDGSLKKPKKRRSIQMKAGFDTQEYIEHIEKELQDARNEMFSPTTNRSLRDQLRTARFETEKLRQEMADMREALETEVKRTIEQRTAIEVQWKRRVRDLEEELEQKASIISDLEMQHVDKRLENNTIDTLKASIEKLEQDKISLQDENRSVNKRNEVLSELLAMSPTKSSMFELRSPVREKRGGRPMSMIIPRRPLSPGSRQVSQPASAAVSPSLSATKSFFSHLKPEGDATGSVESSAMFMQRAREGCLLGDRDDVQLSASRPGSDGTRSRRSTLQSQVSTGSSITNQPRTSSPLDEALQRAFPKRKPRKFMSGSTQLKPLLLPAITGDTASQPSASSASSPRFHAMHESAQYFVDEVAGPIALPAEINPPTSGSDATENDDVTSLQPSSELVLDGYQTFEQILAEQEAIVAVERTESSVIISSESTHSPTESLEDTRRHYRYGLGRGREQEIDSCDIQQPEPLSSAIDLDALSELRLPQAEYEAFPVLRPGDDSQDILDIPQPLFSPEAPSVRAFRPNHLIKLSSDYRPPTRIYNPLVPGQLEQPSATCGHWKAESLDNDIMQTPSKELIHRNPVPQAPTTPVSHETRSELPQRSTLRATEQLTRTRSPLEVLHHGKLGARPLASLTIRTIFGTIAQCTKYMKDLKQDPLALARKALAHAWFSNWKRFGRLSWWILGLFISPALGGPKIRKWEWDKYDGEAIARKACEESSQSYNLKSVQNTDSNTATQPKSKCLAHHPTVETSKSRGDQGSKHTIGWGRSIALWGKFSVAIMMAVGGAVVRGPGEMLRDMDGQTVPENDNEPSPRPILGNESSTGQDRPRHDAVIYEQGAPKDRLPGSQYLSYSDKADMQRRGSPGFLEPHRSRSHVPISEYDLQYGSPDGDETLRPMKSPRPNVRHLFDHRPHQDVKSSNEGLNSIKDAENSPNSIDSRTVLWPPSLEPT